MAKMPVQKIIVYREPKKKKSMSDKKYQGDKDPFDPKSSGWTFIEGLFQSIILGIEDGVQGIASGHWIERKKK